VTRFRGLAPAGSGGYGILAESIVDRDGVRVRLAAIVWPYSHDCAVVQWSYDGGPFETRRFAIAVSDAGELTIVNVDALGVAEPRDLEDGRF
jgi:hypothetical protein